MAINKITAPSEVPASVSDYQAQNDLLDVLNLAVLGADRVSGSNVVKSSVFNVGGAIYLADADTAITGSASAYVKLTVSVDGLTLDASFVADLTGVSWNTAYLGYYDTDGNLYVFDEADAYISGQISAVYTEIGRNRLMHGAKSFSASSSFRAPPGVTTVFITGTAAGGNGAAGASGSGLSGGGGGGGEWAIKEVFTVTPGTLYTVTIGAVGSNTSFGTFVLNKGNNASGATGGAISSRSHGTGRGGAGGNAGSGGVNATSGGDGLGRGGTYGGSAAAGGGGGGGYREDGFGGETKSNAGGRGYSGGGGGSIGNPVGGFGGAGGAGGGGGGGGYGTITGGAGGAGGAAFLIVEW